METSELIEIIARGEDSKNQFKTSDVREESLAQEMIAFSNTEGGRIFVGITPTNEVEGLTNHIINEKRLDNRISNAANSMIKPPIAVETENILHPEGVVIAIKVFKGISKPYMDRSGNIFVKNGADKRKVSSPDELLRMFQASNRIHGDEQLANGLSLADVDRTFFESFFQNEYGENLEQQENSLQIIFENMNLAKSGALNIAGALLFAKQPYFRLPAYIAKAVAYPGNDIDEENYIDSRDIVGKISDIFQQIISFISRNIRQKQSNQNINSLGESEVPRIVLEELIANALIHRDYFISAPIRIFIFNNRIEIISPGHLPNNLTIENIKSGNSNIRNPILASFATKLLPYRGLGNGIRRALKAYPKIDFIDDRENNCFKVIIKK
ncbi:MAG TPA: putative DNA binding domain-containing protein [Thermotogota bacterium]|nr:putative DNA binding domain-containing protein [Thermotogota bacterium]HRW34131.1 putative DNA binding domain-containing protein [Thermotogota bacterium]